MTEQELAEIQARAGEPDPESAIWREGDTLNQAAALVLDRDVPALLAEVRRLQRLIQQAEWRGGDGSARVCPWCDYEGRHGATCPAFPPVQDTES